MSAFKASWLKWSRLHLNVPSKYVVEFNIHKGYALQRLFQESWKDPSDDTREVWIAWQQTGYHY